MTLKLDDLTLGEMAMAEDLSGQPLGALAEDNTPKTRLLIALVSVIQMRENPAYTIQDAEKLTMKELNSILDIGGSDDSEVDATKS